MVDNIGRDTATPVMNAYYSDILPSHLKTIGYGMSFGVAGLMLFLGAGIATGVTLLYDANGNWLAILIVYVIVKYIYFCIN